MGIELRAKVAQRRGYWIETQLAMAAQGTGLHVFSNVAHQGQVFFATFQAANTLENLEKVAHAHPAWETFPARLVLAKCDESPRQIHDACVFIGGNDPA